MPNFVRVQVMSLEMLQFAQPLFQAIDELCLILHYVDQSFVLDHSRGDISSPTRLALDLGFKASDILVELPVAGLQCLNGSTMLDEGHDDEGADSCDGQSLANIPFLRGLLLLIVGCLVTPSENREGIEKEDAQKL